MPTITGALGGRALFGWVFTAFLLASTLGVMLAGKFGDHYGRRPTFLGALLLFLIGTALCGMAPSMGWLIAFRVVQGLGAGALQPTTMTITADIYTLEERAAMQSVITAVWGIANVLGPVIGGWIVGHTSWRWVFLVNLPVGVLSAVLLAISYRDAERPAGRLELSGPLLGGFSTALLLVALEQHAPGALRIGGALAGVALALLFVRSQRRTTQPLIPFAYLGDRNIQTGLLGGALVGALLYGTATFVPLWVTERGHSALLAGFVLVPMLAAWAVGSNFGVKLLIRGGMRASTGGGFIVAAIGATLLGITVYLELPIGWEMASLAVLGLGMGPAASTSILGPQTVVPWNTRSIVTSAMYSTRTIGGAVTIALLELVGRRTSHQLMLIAPIALVGSWWAYRLAPAGALQGDVDARELTAVE